MHERCNYLLVNFAFKRHDELRKCNHRLPFPRIEFGRVAAGRRVDGDFAFMTFKAEGKPFLCLAAKLAFERNADEVRGQIIVDPIGRFANQRR